MQAAAVVLLVAAAAVVVLSTMLVVPVLYAFEVHVAYESRTRRQSRAMANRPLVRDDVIII